MGRLPRDITVGVCWGAGVLVAALSVAHVQEQSRDALALVLPEPDARPLSLV